MLIRALVLAALASPLASAPLRAASGPETIELRSGTLTLSAQVWRPVGRGPSPAVLFNHGSYSSDDRMPAEDPEALGRVFARHGYVFLFVFRQGTGPSAGQGTPAGDQMARALADAGQEGRNRVQMRLLDGEEMAVARAGLAWLRGRPEVDGRRIGVAGHSFGGSLMLLMAEQDPELRAAVVFGGAAWSWKRSPTLRDRLLTAVRRMAASVLFIHAANDYSVEAGQALAAEMQRAGKPHRLKIYPAFGRTPREGHNIVFRSVPTWEADVFGFLEEHLRPISR